MKAKRPKSVSFIVTFTKPDGALLEDCRVYLEDSMRAWAGSLRPPLSYDDHDPGDSMWGLDRDSIKVRWHRS